MKMKTEKPEMKLIAIPVEDAFPHHKWAKSDAIKGYLAVIPAAGRARAKIYNRIRRDNLRRILELAEESSSASSSSRKEVKNSAVHLSPSPEGPTIDLKKLKLPTSIRVHYDEKITYRSGLRRKICHVYRDGHFSKIVAIQDIIDYGVAAAIRLSKMKDDPVVMNTDEEEAIGVGEGEGVGVGAGEDAR